MPKDLVLRLPRRVMLHKCSGDCRRIVGYLRYFGNDGAQFGYAKNVLNIKKIKVIITLDDDIIFTKKTVPTLLNKLYFSSNTGSVCSLARVKNKNNNCFRSMGRTFFYGFI